MRLGVLGGHARTGRQLVALARAAGHEVQVLEGDVLDAAALDRAVAGVDAVVSLIGPRADSPAGFCERATRAVLASLERAGVRRLVMVTGAMCGPRTELGLFYRALIRVPSLAKTLDDRRAQEAAVIGSALDWTLVRPPRLSDAEPRSPARVRLGGPVGMLASCSRAHLAATLLEVASTGAHVREAIYVDSLR
ncbi:MAG: NAD(P)H-binding protein [Myxococcaceae bacterium]